MKRHFLACILILTPASAIDIDLTLAVAPVSMVQSGMSTFFNDLLVPKLDSIGFLPANVGLKFFPHPNIGLSLGYDPSAVGSGYAKGYSPLKLYNYSELRVGPVLRIPFGQDEDYGTVHSLQLEGGVLVGFFAFDTQFQEIFPSYARFLFKDSSSFTSWYAGVNYVFRFLNFMHLSLGCRFESFSLSPKIGSTTENFSGYHIYVPIGFGVSFGTIPTSRPKPKS